MNREDRMLFKLFGGFLLFIFGLTVIGMLFSPGGYYEMKHWNDNSVQTICQITNVFILPTMCPKGKDFEPCFGGYIQVRYNHLDTQFNNTLLVHNDEFASIVQSHMNINYQNNQIVCFYQKYRPMASYLALKDVDTQKTYIVSFSFILVLIIVVWIYNDVKCHIAKQRKQLQRKSYEVHNVSSNI